MTAAGLVDGREGFDESRVIAAQVGEEVVHAQPGGKLQQAARGSDGNCLGSHDCGISMFVASRIWRALASEFIVGLP